MLGEVNRVEDVECAVRRRHGDTGGKERHDAPLAKDFTNRPLRIARPVRRRLGNRQCINQNPASVAAITHNSADSGSRSSSAPVPITATMNPIEPHSRMRL
jgi:hypothetical protein